MDEVGVRLVPSFLETLTKTPGGSRPICKSRTVQVVGVALKVTGELVLFLSDAETRHAVQMGRPVLFAIHRCQVRVLPCGWQTILSCRAKRV